MLLISALLPESASDLIGSTMSCHWVRRRHRRLFLRPFLESSNFLILAADERHWTLLEEVLASLTYPAGNLFFDVRTAVLLREHGIKEIYTTDAGFLQFPHIKVINPLR